MLALLSLTCLLSTALRLGVGVALGAGFVRRER